MYHIAADSSFHACPQMTLFALYNSKTIQVEINPFENKTFLLFVFPWLPGKIVAGTHYTFSHRKGPHVLWQFSLWLSSAITLV